MYRHILVPTDGTALSGRAVKHAISLARQVGAKLTALHVVGDFPPGLMDEGYVVPDVFTLKKRFEEEEVARAKQLLGAVQELARGTGVDCSTATMAAGSPYEAIVDFAARSNCDLIVMASHGRRGISGLLLGSETVKVLTHSKVPVLVCR
jgi:nucleotide-binding universal stress UspA family protein